MKLMAIMSTCEARARATLLLIAFKNWDEIHKSKNNWFNYEPNNLGTLTTKTVKG